MVRSIECIGQNDIECLGQNVSDYSQSWVWKTIVQKTIVLCLYYEHVCIIATPARPAQPDRIVVLTALQADRSTC